MQAASEQPRDHSGLTSKFLRFTFKTRGKKNVAARRLLRMRPTFSKSVMVSVT